MAGLGSSGFGEIFTSECVIEHRGVEALAGEEPGGHEHSFRLGQQLPSKRQGSLMGRCGIAGGASGIAAAQFKNRDRKSVV